MDAVNLSVQRVTRGPQHHFFGYYDKSPWDHEGRYILALETTFMDRPPTADDAATIGVVDLREDCAFRPLTLTHAWNWQQGCMAQWLPKSRRFIIYNDLQGGHFVSVIRSIEGGDAYTLPLPVYAVSHNGRRALTLNFARLARTRPGYGYNGVIDPRVTEKRPVKDGIYLLDLATGESDLIVSIAQMTEFHPRPDMENAVHWFNHILFSPDDRRFIFLHRWTSELGRPWKTRLLTADVDGGDLYLLTDDDMVSHFDWRDPQHILAWARKKDIGDRYFLFTDHSNDFQVIGEEVLTSDGHCSYSPDRRWILTDTYPDIEQKRRLLLYNPEEKRLVEIGRFYSQPELRGEIRCDLHPRWSHDGHHVCIDSTHEGSRQMYIIDVSSIVGE